MNDGAPDAAFGTGGLVVTPFDGLEEDEPGGCAMDVKVDAKGRIVAAGFAPDLNIPGQSGYAVVRYLADGSPDPTFGNGGQVFTTFPGQGHSQAGGVAVDTQGRIFVSGAVRVGRRQFHRCRLLQRVRLCLPRPALRICREGGVRRPGGKPGRAGRARLLRHDRQHSQSGRAARELLQEDGFHPSARRAAAGRGQAYRRRHASIRRGAGRRLPRSLAPPLRHRSAGPLLRRLRHHPERRQPGRDGRLYDGGRRRERQADRAQQHRRGSG